MVPTSVPAAGVFVLMLAPGLLFELGLARRLTYLRRPLADRILRFIAWSLLLNALVLPLTLFVASSIPRRVESWEARDYLWAWSAGVLLTVGPFLAGGLVSGSRGAARAWVLGVDPAPLAWHELWESMSHHSDTYVRVRLRESGDWLAGRWNYSSDEPEDILLAPRIECDPRTGRLILGEGDRPRPVDWQALIRCADVDRIEAQGHAGNLSEADQENRDV